VIAVIGRSVDRKSKTSPQMNTDNTDRLSIGSLNYQAITI
jgi:hypothetical protein